MNTAPQLQIHSINDAAIYAGLDDIIKLAKRAAAIPELEITYCYDEVKNTFALLAFEQNAKLLSPEIDFNQPQAVAQLDKLCKDLAFLIDGNTSTNQVSASITPINTIAPVIQLHSGQYFNVKHPEKSDFNIEDIAHALAHLCRFNGHTKQFYSVAQHSVLVSETVPHEHALAGLMHDGAEAYCGDISTPLKQLLPDYKAIATNIERHLFQKIGLPYPMPHCVKQADMQLLATEKRDLMPSDVDYWDCIAHITPLQEQITPLTPLAAKQQFLDRFFQLISDKNQIRAAS